MKRTLTSLLIICWAGVGWAGPLPLLAQANIAALTDNLQVFLDFEDRYTDQSDIAREIVLEGTITYIDGQRGKGATLGPIDAYLTIEDATGIDGVGGLSWAGWFKRPDTTTAVTPLFKASVYQWKMDEASNGEFYGFVTDASSNLITYTSTGDAAEDTD